MRNMKKSFLVFTVVLLVLAAFGSQFLVSVEAKPPEVTYDSTYHYTRQVGQLGGATYEIMIPDNWNGHLVIGCKGFTTSVNPIPPIDSIITHTIGLQFMVSTAEERFAYAQSTYGTVGFCVKEGMIRIHQLTRYVIGNFQVTGKVFLIGVSMGGQIALMLTHKYPDLYAGVLDICGSKDTTAFYNYWRDLSKLPADASAIRAYLNGPPAYLPTPFTDSIADAQLLSMRMNALSPVMTDIETECGGTPESKPQAYDRISPTCHPELRVPVISLLARSDLLVPIQHQNDYYDAVQAAGCMDCYRCYKFPTTHGGPPIIAAVPTYFQILFDWVNGGPAPPATPKPYP
jgi:hypothetical protein